MFERFLALAQQLLRIDDDTERADRRVESIAAQAARHAAECQKAGHLAWLGDNWTPEKDFQLPDANVSAWSKAWCKACAALCGHLPNRLPFDFGGLSGYQAKHVKSGG